MLTRHYAVTASLGLTLLTAKPPISITVSPCRVDASGQWRPVCCALRCVSIGSRNRTPRTRVSRLDEADLDARPGFVSALRVFGVRVGDEGQVMSSICFTNA